MQPAASRGRYASAGGLRGGYLAMTRTRTRGIRNHWLACCALLGAALACVALNAIRPREARAEEATRPSGGAIAVFKAGDALREGATHVRLSQALAHPEDYQGQVVRLEGTIEQVCPMKGCWLLLRDGDARARVTFKDYAFFVPTDSGGKTVRLDAEVARETISEALAVHLEAETEGGDPASIRGPQAIVSVVARGVEILEASPPK